ncbi:MAG: phosphate ABC transporter substrate-binding protein [Endomicrobium sp.]|jgi:phosphate transport system substrate-binding protein|nr:phosphate ABC transporter substrate-binding protein [Endomicrobium sp.]
MYHKLKGVGMCFNSHVRYCFKKVILFFLVFLFFCSCSKSQSKRDKYFSSIQIKGSDTVVNLIQELSEEFSKRYPLFNIGITGGGSGTGFVSLINKTCDIAMSSRKIEEKESALAKSKNIELDEFKIGLDGIVVIVNKNNSVDKLTLEQLRDIFTARITNWKEVGGEDRKVVVLSRESNSGTHIFFKERVLGRDDGVTENEFAVQSLIMPSSQAIYNEVFQNPNALGYVGIGFQNDGVKAISIAVSANSGEYICPTLENVMNCTYPISRPLYLYTNRNPHKVVKMFVDYVLSESGQKIVLKTSFVPIKMAKQRIKN